MTDAKVGIHNGVDGLVGGEVKDIAWADVDGWIGQVTGEDGQDGQNGLISKALR